MASWDNFETYNAGTQRKMPDDFFDVPADRMTDRRKTPYGDIQASFPIPSATPTAAPQLPAIPPPPIATAPPASPSNFPASATPASTPTNIVPMDAQDTPPEPDEMFHHNWLQEFNSGFDQLIQGVGGLVNPAQAAPQNAQPLGAAPVVPAAIPAQQPVTPKAPQFVSKTNQPQWNDVWGGRTSDDHLYEAYKTGGTPGSSDSSQDQTARYYGRVLARGISRGRADSPQRGQIGFGNQDLGSVARFQRRRPDAISDYFKRHPEELQGG